MLSKIVQVSAQGLESGSIMPFRYDITRHPVEGIEWLIHCFTDESRATLTSKYSTKREGDPFEPYEPELFVQELGKEHFILLNKYPQFDHSMLCVTKSYESQKQHLRKTDIRAMWQCIQAINGFAFYNCGDDAGYSQPHRHMQLVPMRSDSPNASSIPIHPWVMDEAKRRQKGEVFRIPQFPFHHGIVMHTFPAATTIVGSNTPLTEEQQQEETVNNLFGSYQRLLRENMLAVRHHFPSWKKQVITTELTDDLEELNFTPNLSYNFICTSEWCMLVPRKQSSDSGIFLNSLGLMGYTFVRFQSLADRSISEGPIRILQNVTFPLTE